MLENPSERDDYTPETPEQTEESGAYRYTGAQLPKQTDPAAQPVTNREPEPRTEPETIYMGQSNGYGNSGYNPQATSGYPNYGSQNSAYNAGYQVPNGQTARPYGQTAEPQRPEGSYGYYHSASNPMSGYNVKPPEKKKSSGGKRVVALAIVCALIGGLGGGAAVGMALKNSSFIAAPVEESQEAEENETQAAGDADTKQSTAKPAENINSTVIDVTTNSDTTNMTPQNVYEQYVNAVVAISNRGVSTNIWGQYTQTASSGSGFIISDDGYIITNNHVVKGAQELKVIMTNGSEYEATVIGADAENDVALIKIDATDLPTVSVGSSETLEVGQQVCAIGNPLGELTNTLTVGYVSALDREINENGTPINMFQTDCAINSGNSGGPIFDMHGNVIGITTAKYSSNGSGYSASIEGIGFCIPIDDAMSIVSDLLQYGYVKGRPSLGISCQAISSTVTQYYNLPTGVYVTAVQDGSAASKAGLQEGDIITGIDGTDCASVTAFKAKLKEYSAGDTAVLSVYRTDTAEKLELTITFDEKNVNATSQNAAPSIENSMP